MSPRADILIQDINERPIAIVEIKNWSNLVPEGITNIYEQFKEYNSNLTPTVPYLLLVSPKKGFLWKQPLTDPKPTLEFPMDQVIARYLADPIAREHLRESELVLIILEWLTDLAWLLGEQADEPEKSLNAEGFLAAIREASVLPEVPLYAYVH